MTVDALNQVIEQAVSAAGYKLYAYQVIGQQPTRILRILIEQVSSTADQQKGVLIEDCRQVSRQVSLALEVAEPPVMTGHYNLEVSSPGIERPLLQPHHFSAVQGQRIRLQLYSPLPELSGSKKCKAKLLTVSTEHIQLLLDHGEELLIAFTQIDKARVEYDWNTKKNNKASSPSKRQKKNKQKTKAS